MKYRALVVASESCLSVVQEIFAGEQAAEYHLAGSETERLALLDEYRFDVEVFVEDGVPALEAELPSIGSRGRRPRLRIGAKPGLSGDAAYEVVLGGSNDAEAVRLAIHRVVNRSRAVLRILVVDDEPAVRRVTAAFLKRAGHEVDTAADGGEALQRIDSADYDVLISDLRMPGVDGAALLRALKERKNPLADRTFFITGDPPADLSAFGIPMMTKPVQMERVVELAETMAEFRAAGG